MKYADARRLAREQDRREKALVHLTCSVDELPVLEPLRFNLSFRSLFDPGLTPARDRRFRHSYRSNRHEWQAGE